MRSDGNRHIGYSITRSARKTIAIQIKADGEVVVRAPKYMGSAEIQRFVESKSLWIEKQLAKVPAVTKLTDAELQALVQQAKEVIPRRVAYFAPLVGVSYERITIRSQHTRWGSCSGKGNLNFNCLLMLAPLEVVDYVVVHELCHRKEMNHSQKFWAEVARVFPDYQASKKWLREYGQALIARLGQRYTH